MHKFEEILRDLILAGSVVAPIFIHSQKGVLILNASEEGLGAILQAHSGVGNSKSIENPTKATSG